MKERSIKKVGKIDHVKYVLGMMCSLSSTDQQKNNVSLFNVIDEIAFQEEGFKDVKTPIYFPHEIVICLRRTLNPFIDQEEIPMELKIKNIDPTENVLEENFSQMIFPAGKKILRLTIAKQGITISTIGDYVYQLEINLPNTNSKVLAEIPFEIKKIAKKQ